MRRLHNAAIALEQLSRQKNNTPSQAVYCEQEIIDLHNMFLTNGVHYISVVDLKQGRELVQTFLTSLHCYTSIACLTLSHEQLADDVCDVYAELATEYSPIINGDIIEQYLLDRFYFDFLWIEASPQLLNTAWYPEFEDKLTSINLDCILPIIVILPDMQ